MGERPNLDRIKDRAQDVRKDVNALALETVDALRKAVDESITRRSSNGRSIRSRRRSIISKWRGGLTGRWRNNPASTVDQERT